MTPILVFPGILALFWALMLFFKKDGLRAHKVIAVGLLTYTAAYVLFCTLFVSWSGMVVALLFLTCALMVPFIHRMFFSLAVDVDKAFRVDYIYIAVVFVFILAFAVMALLSGPDMDDAFYHNVVMGEAVDVPSGYESSPLWKMMTVMGFRIYPVMLSLSGISVFVYAFVNIVKYDKCLDEYFAGREMLEKKNNLFVFLSAVFGLVPMVLLLAQPFYMLRGNLPLQIVCVSMSAIAIFLVGFYAYRINFTAEQILLMIDEDNEKRKLADEVPQDDVKTSGIIFSETLTRLETAMEVEKVYLDPDLTLVGLSDRLKTNRTYLSKVINLNYDCTFSEFINNHRIEYALAIIRERNDNGVTLKEVSSECGYANQASFIRNFTKIVGMTPSEYVLEGESADKTE